MIRPPPQEEIGAAGALTPTGPDQVPSCQSTSKKPRRDYPLKGTAVNVASADACPRDSEGGSADARCSGPAEKVELKTCGDPDSTARPVPSEPHEGQSFLGRPKYVSWKRTIERNTGHKVNADTWLDGQLARAKLKQQAEAFCDRMEKLTGESYRRESTLSLVDVLTGQSELLPGYRNSNLNPLIARPKRKKLCDQLEAFCSEKLTERTRAHYWVLTSGERCSGSEMDARRATLSRAVTLLNRPLQENFGVEIIFKGLEVTVKREEITSWHVHANLVVLQHRRLGRRQWEKMKALVDSKLKAHWHSCGELKDVREVCKYVTKLDDLDKIDDEDFLRFAESIQGARLNEAFNSFREFRKELDEMGCRVRKVLDDDGVFRWVREFKRTRVAPEVKEIGSNRPSIVAITAPLPAFSPELSPCLLVANYDGDYERLFEDSPQAEEVRVIALDSHEAKRLQDGSHLHLNSTSEERPLAATWEPQPDPPPGSGLEAIPF